MDKVSASQTRNHEFEPQTDNDHDSLYKTSTGQFQEVLDLRVIHKLIRFNINIFQNIPKSYLYTEIHKTHLYYSFQ